LRSLLSKVSNEVSKLFNQLELARETKKIGSRWGEEGLERKYTDFYSLLVYRGIATGGCGRKATSPSLLWV